MTLRAAPSTPRPLPRKREHAKERPAIALASATGTSMQLNSSGLTPTKAIQEDEAPLPRRRHIQTNKASALTRQDNSVPPAINQARKNEGASA